MPTRKKKIQTKAGSLYERALKLAKAETLERLFLETRLPISWLRKFRQGNIPNPSVNRVETLLKAFGQL